VAATTKKDEEGKPLFQIGPLPKKTNLFSQTEKIAIITHR
jgi:hypothetical protein